MTDDPYEREKEDRRERDGGVVTAYNGAQVVFSWGTKINPYDRELPHVASALAERRKMIAAWRTLRTRRARVARVNHAEARARLESAGEDALKGYTTTAKSRMFVVRIWYRSLGDESCVCDSAPMSAAHANAHLARVPDGAPSRHVSDPTWLPWVLCVEVFPLLYDTRTRAQPGDMLTMPEVACARWVGASDAADVLNAIGKRNVDRALAERARLLATAPREARYVVFPDRVRAPVEIVEADA